MWDLLGPGIEPVSPALAGGFLTTEPPGKHVLYFLSWSLQFSSVTQLCLTLCNPMNHSTPGIPTITNSWSLFKLMSIESVMPSSHLILCCPLLLLPPIPPSIRIFSNESIRCMRWPKYWSFSFSISPSNEHPGVISFRIDWFDLLAVQGTLSISTSQKCLHLFIKLFKTKFVINLCLKLNIRKRRWASQVAQ